MLTPSWSLVLTLVFIAVACAMMSPGIHLLVTVPVLFALGLAVRFVATLEGREDH